MLRYEEEDYLSGLAYVPLIFTHPVPFPYPLPCLGPVRDWHRNSITKLADPKLVNRPEIQYLPTEKDSRMKE